MGNPPDGGLRADSLRLRSYDALRKGDDDKSRTWTKRNLVWILGLNYGTPTTRTIPRWTGWDWGSPGVSPVRPRHPNLWCFRKDMFFWMFFVLQTFSDAQHGGAQAAVRLPHVARQRGGANEGDGRADGSGDQHGALGLKCDVLAPCNVDCVNQEPASPMKRCSRIQKGNF